VFSCPYIRYDFELTVVFSVFGVRSGTVGCGTALLAGRSRVPFPIVPLEFFTDIILPTALWPWGRLSFQHKWWGGGVGVKAAGAQS